MGTVGYTCANLDIKAQMAGAEQKSFSGKAVLTAESGDTAGAKNP